MLKKTAFPILWGAVLATAWWAAPVQATPFIGQPAGITGATRCIGFCNPGGLAKDCLVTNQFAACGVTFSAGLTYNPQGNGYPHIGACSELGNFGYTGGCPGGEPEVSCIQFTQCVTAASFALSTDGCRGGFTTLNAFHGSCLACSFNACIPACCNNNFYGFCGTTPFNRIQIVTTNVTSGPFFNLDTLAFKASAAAAPELDVRSATAPLAAGLALLLVASDRRRRLQ